MKTILTLCPALGGPNDAHPDGIDSVLLPDPSRRGFNAGMPGEVPNAVNVPQRAACTHDVPMLGKYAAHPNLS
ncbi:MAG TPA: hypothetical protein GX509_05785 [Firmicutes bacterium]|nr:hypothetical protein [Bacillota bacterium]